MIGLSVQEQDRRIRAVFPDFGLTLNSSWMGVWEGPLTPIMRRYRIRVTYFRRRFFESWTLTNVYAAVRVVHPVIGLDPRGTGEVAPHIYFNKTDPKKSPAFVCTIRRRDPGARRNTDRRIARGSLRCPTPTFVI